MKQETNVTGNPRAFHRGVSHLTRLHHKLCEKRLEDLAIHRSQHMLLMHLAHSKEPPSQKELAAHLEISPAAVAVSLKRLEVEGYITRTAPKDDSRINEIAITEKGRSIVEESRHIFDGIDEEIFEGISATELSATIDVIRRIEANIKAKIDQA